MAAIPPPTWQHHERIWTKVSDAAAGHSTNCRSLGSLELTDPSTEFPGFCESRASLLGSDTFEVLADLSRCDFKLCGAYRDMNFGTQQGGMSSYSRLVGGWTQVLRGADGFGIGCEYVGSYEPGAGEPVPAACEWQAALLGSDSMDVKLDGSACYFKRCGSLADIVFSDAFGGYDSYTILGGEFLQITQMLHGVGTDCSYKGSADLDSTEDPEPNSTTPPLACVSQGLLIGADTFDYKPGKCYFKQCGTLQDMLFTDRFGPYETYTTLGGRWSQVTRAADGHSVDCTDLGSLVVSDPVAFPQVCYSKAIILGGDTLDAEADGSTCYFKRCGALKDLRFSDSLGGRQTHTTLTGGWSAITKTRDGMGIGCDYLGSYTPIDTSDFPNNCFSQGIIRGANAMDYRVHDPKCYYKACERFGEFSFTENFGAYDTYTLLFPRSADAWGPCDPPNCLDLHLLWTNNLRGLHLPVGSSGSTCDPDDADACFGGAARRAAYAQAKRAELAKTNETVVLVDLGGGNFGGPLWDHPQYPKGLAGTMLQNQVPYDFCVVSPRDFLTQDDDYSRALTVQSLGNRTCTFISSNVRFAGAWSSMNSKTVPYAVVPTLNGAKVAFVSMFPHQSDYGYGFGNGVLDLDSAGLGAQLLAGTSAADLRLSAETLSAALTGVATEYDLLDDHLRDVYVMSTVAPMDVLRAAMRARRAHPDLQAVVLLVGGANRPDSTMWLAQTGTFDVILGGRDAGLEPELVEVDGRKTLLASSNSLLGMGYARVRVASDVGVKRFEVKGDVPLDATVPADDTVQALMSQLFQINRERLAQPYGTLSNPLTGTHRGQSAPPTMNQCYYMECPASRIVGDALLWKGRSEGHQVDVSFYNFGGYRTPLEGLHANRTILAGHCIDSLKFQNVLKIYNILGRDLYELIKKYMTFEAPGAIGAGWRAAFHEPCWSYVNHNSFPEAENVPPGTVAEIERCRNEGVANVNLVMIDVEVLHTDWDKCSDYTSCSATEWRTLEKGATYTLAATDFLMSENSGFQPLDIGLGSDALALCDYVAAKGAVQVESFETYLQRGSVQYPTAQDGWAAGLRIASVATPDSILDAASTCPPGKHLPARARSCQDCPAGTHSEEALVDGTLTPICRECTAGFFSNRSGMAACQPCAPGTYISELGGTACQDCLPGFLSEAGSIRCTSCMPGSFSAINGSSSCLGCPIGQFAEGSQSSECTTCPASFVTKYPSSTSSEDCICDQGNFLQPGQGCLGCGEGLLCQGGNQEPSQVAGFWVMTGGARLLSVAQNNSDTASASQSQSPRNYVTFSCRNRNECPAGPLGTCASGREGTACSSCIKNHHPDGSSGICVKCEAWDVLPSVAFAILLPLLLAGLMVLTANDATTAHHTMITVSCVAGQVVMATQALVATQQVQISYPAPLSDLMEFLSVFSLDLTFLRLPCLLTSDNPTQVFVLKLLLYPIFSLLLLFLQKASRILKRPIKTEVLFNTNGWLLFTLYITMALTVMLPFQCRSNPSGFLTMATNPGLKCFEDEEHKVLTGLAVVGTLVYPIGTLAWAWYVTVTYTSKMLSAGGIVRLRRYKFLFGRYKPTVYYYGLMGLIKNSLVALIPVVLVRLATIQILFMGGVLMISSMLQVWLMPWRTPMANFCDALLGLLLSLTVLGIATLLGGDEGEGEQGKMVGIAAFVLILLLFLVGFSVTVWAVYRRLFPGDRFGIFLCHHKAGAGALCRLMKLIIEPHTYASVFLDSDHLEDLDMLFDIVRSRVSNLVVVLTKSVLTRPWCAGEIVTSHRNGVRIVPMYCPDFDGLTELEMHSIVDNWTEEELSTLITYDITTEMVLQAFKYVMTLQTIEMPRFQSLAQKQLAIRNVMAACRLSVRTLDSKISSEAHSQAQAKAKVMIMGAVDDAEGLASCEIVQVILQRKLEMELAVVRNAEEVSFHRSTATVVLVLLSEGLLMNEPFVKLLLEVYMGQEGVLVGNGAGCGGDIQFLTVNVNSAFKFPPADYFKKVEAEGLPLPGLGPEEGQGLIIAGVFRTMLAIMSKPFTPHGATASIDVQMEDLSSRLKRLLNTGQDTEQVRKRLSSWDRKTRARGNSGNLACRSNFGTGSQGTDFDLASDTDASRMSGASDEMLENGSKWGSEMRMSVEEKTMEVKIPTRTARENI